MFLFLTSYGVKHGVSSGPHFPVFGLNTGIYFTQLIVLVKRSFCASPSCRKNTHLICGHNFKCFVPNYLQRLFFLFVSIFQQVQTTNPPACYIPSEVEFYEDSKNADFESIKCNLKILYAFNIFSLLLPNFFVSLF